MMALDCHELPSVSMYEVHQASAYEGLVSGRAEEWAHMLG